MKDKSSSMSAEAGESLVCDGSAMAISLERRMRLEFCIFTATMIAVTSCRMDGVQLRRLMFSEHNLKGKVVVVAVRGTEVLPKCESPLPWNTVRRGLVNLPSSEELHLHRFAGPHCGGLYVRLFSHCEEDDSYECDWLIDSASAVGSL